MNGRQNDTKARWFALLITGAMLSGCQSSNDGAPVAPAEGRLTGTVLYRERVALTPDATIEVRLEDVSHADAPAVVLAEAAIATNGRQVPIPFELRYAADRIEPRNRYGVRAAIRTADGRLLFATTTHHAVLEGGQPTENVEVLVQRVAGDGGAAGAPGATGDTGSITAGPWRLVAIQRPAASEEAVGPEPPYTIEFGADGRYSGQAHCNRYTGGYQRPEPGRLTTTGGAATLAACPPPSIAGEFLQAIGAVTGYEVRGEELRLAFGAGGVLTFAREFPTAAAAPEVGRTFVYDCDGDVSFTVRPGPGEVALWAPESLGGRYVVLGMTRTASGARYEDGDTVYWNKGNLATFEIAGQRFVDCRSNPAKAPWADAARRGVTFRALGNEPSWSLEITPDRLTMITDLGASRAELPYSQPSIAGQRTTYRLRTEAHELVATIDRGACTDSMSGEAFEATATVTFDGAMYYGCGRFL
jgi:uncharacterized lipoprotein YbaY/uncharacterized membrane protein/heat shock protein HslJ